MTLSSYLASIAGDFTLAQGLSEQAKGTTKYPLIDCPVNWGLALAACGLGDNRLAANYVRDTLQIAVAQRSHTFKLLGLPIVAVLAARKDDFERAAEMLGLASTAPEQLMGWANKWPILNEVKAKLERRLGTDQYQTRLGHGKTLDLETIVMELTANP